jgi:hypothetical protein
MERVLDFSDVTSYDFSLMGPDMILELFQGDVVTKIRIGTDKTKAKPEKVIANIATQQQTVINAVSRPPQPLKHRKIPLTRLNETQVKEIRGNWEATVQACGTKNAAADQLAKVYNCSAKNIYAIIYRYSWANV